MEKGAIPHDQEQPQAALTPRPRRLLLVGRVELGQEQAVRDAQGRFPFDAAAEAGISAVEAFLGSGYYAIWLEIDSDDVQAVLAAYVNHPAVRAFHAALRPIVDGLPDPDLAFGASDPFHGDPHAPGTAPTDPPSSFGTADLPLAASMYRWSMG
jgi:hypothetical protein